MNTVSAVSSFVGTKATGNAPSAPTNLAVASSSIGLTYMTITFTAPADVVDYTVKLTQTSPVVSTESNSVIVRQFKGATSYQIIGLTKNTTYNLELFANNLSGTSAPATLSSLRTLNGTMAVAPTLSWSLLNSSYTGGGPIAVSRDLKYVFMANQRANGLSDIYMSSDGGVTFRVVYTNTDYTYMPSLVCSQDGRYVYASGTNVYMSNNFGQSFRSVLFHNVVNSVLACDESGRYVAITSTQPGLGSRIWWSNNYCATITTKTGVINGQVGRQIAIDARTNTIFYLSDNGNAYYYTAPNGFQNLNDISNLVPVIMNNSSTYISNIPNSVYSMNMSNYYLYANQGFVAGISLCSGVKSAIAVWDSSYNSFKQPLGPKYITSNGYRMDWVVTEGSVNFIAAGASNTRSDGQYSSPSGTATYSFDGGSTWYDLSGVYPFNQNVKGFGACVKDNNLNLMLISGYGSTIKLFKVVFSNIYPDKPTNTAITSVGTTFANISLTAPTNGYVSGYSTLANIVYPAAPTYSFVETSFTKTITFDSSGNSQLSGLMPGQIYGISLSTVNNVGTALPTSDLYVYTSDVSMSNPTIASSTVHDGTTIGINAMSFIAVPKSKPENVYVTASNSDDYATFVYVSNNYGSTFTQTYSNYSANEVLGIVCSDNGQYVFMSINDQYIYRSTDHGQTFAIVSTGSGLVESFNLYINCSGSGQYVAIVQANYGHVYWSSNYGLTFTKKSSVVSRFGQHIAINSNTSTIYVTGKTSFKYYTASGGLSTITDISAVSFSNTNTALTYNGTIPTYYPRFITTSRQLTVAVDYVTSPYVLISSTGASGFASATGTFTGAGTWKWSVIESKLNFILVGSTTANKAFYSIDNGSSWIDLSGVAPYTNAGIITAASAIVNDKVYIYLATLDGVVYLSTFSITQTAASAPSAPSGLSITPSSTSATINFSTPTIPVQSYTITAVATNPSYEFTVSRTFTSGSGYIMTGLEPGTTYTFTLTATNPVGSASSSVSATTQTVSVPANPTFSSLVTTTLRTAGVYYGYMAVPRKNPAYVYIAMAESPWPFSKYFYKSTDYGQTYTMKTVPDIYPYIWPTITALAFGNMICSDDGKYLFTADRAANGQYNVLKSSDYGETFGPVYSLYTTTGGYFDPMACSSTGQYFAFVWSQQRILAWSSDYGNTFTYKTITLAQYDVRSVSIDEYKNTIYVYALNTMAYSTISGGLAAITDISNITFTNVSLNMSYAFASSNKLEINRGVMLIGSSNNRQVSVNVPFDLSSTTLLFNDRSGWSNTFQPKAQFMMVGGGKYSRNNGTTWTDLSGQAPFNLPGSSQNYITDDYGASAPQIIAMSSSILDASLNLYMLHTNGNLYTQTISLTLT